MIAIDTNLLVYAHRSDSEWNERAYACLGAVAGGAAAWAIPWPCIHEFFAITTHPRIYDPPSTVAEALAQVDAWLASPTVVLLAEHDHYWPSLRHLIEGSRVTGSRVHDARIATLCVSHGVRELWSADRDFSRFSALRVRNPLTEPSPGP